MPHVPGVSYRSANLSSYDVARKRSKFTYLWSVAVAGLAVWSASGPQSFHTAKASAAVSTPGPLTSVFEGWQAPPLLALGELHPPGGRQPGHRAGRDVRARPPRLRPARARAVAEHPRHQLLPPLRKRRLVGWSYRGHGGD